MNTERELVQVAMNGEGVVGRRHFLRTIGLGAAGLAATAAVPLSFTDWMALQADELQEAQMACILLWMAGGSQPARDLRPQAGYRARRRDQGDQYVGPRHLDRRRLGPDGQGHE